MNFEAREEFCQARAFLVTNSISLTVFVVSEDEIPLGDMWGLGGHRRAGCSCRSPIGRGMGYPGTQCQNF